MDPRFSGSTGTGQPEKTGLTARNRPHIFRFNREKPEPEKTGAFQPEPPAKFPVEPGKTGTGKNRNRKKPELFNRNRPQNSRLNRGKPEPKKTGAFQPEPPAKFPVEPGKTGTGKRHFSQKHCCFTKITVFTYPES